MVAMPAGEDHQLVENRRLFRSGASPILERHLLRDRLAHHHRKLHRWGVTDILGDLADASLGGHFLMSQRIGLRGPFW
jgi:hypothetical protein